VLALIAGVWLLAGEAAPAQWSGGFRPIRPPFPPDAYVPPPPPFGGVIPSVPPSALRNGGPMPHSDADIRRAIQNTLAGDPFLHYFGIHVNVTNGVAILTGTADTWQDRPRAEIDCYAGGAAAVDDRLQVRNP